MSTINANAPSTEPDGVHLLWAARAKQLPPDTWSLANRPRDPKDLARYLGAAAFSGGATFVLSGCRSRGLRGRVDFAPSERLVDKALDLIEPRPDLATQRVQDADGAALIVTVEGYDPAEAPPRQLSSGLYGGVHELKRGRPHAVDRNRVQALERAAGLAPDELAALSTAQKLDPGVLSRLTAAVQVSEDSDPFRALHELGVLSGPHRWSPPTAAAMALAGLPSSAWGWTPRIELRHHPCGLEEAAAGVRRAGSPTVFEGGIAVVLSDLLVALSDFTRVSLQATRAVHEAIVNAVGHRSYAPEHRNEPIHVEHYVDAVLVRSPGAPLARVRMTDESGPQLRFARNPHLMNMLRLLRLARSLGQGRQLLIGGRESRLEPARFEAGSDWFGVALQVAAPPLPVLSRAKAPPPNPVQPGDAPQPVEVEPKAAPTNRRLSSEDRDAQLLAVLRRLGSASSKELAEAAGVSRSTVGNSLKRLVETGQVQATGGGPRSPHRRYKVPGGG